MTECPICMDIIETSKNCVTTECGHCFHSSCLMKNVAHNGFGCPYCRTTMAEEPEDDEETEYTDASPVDEAYGDDELRGMRLFFNNIDGETHDEEDITEETEYEEYLNAGVAREQIPEQDQNVPNVDYVAEKMLSQGITYEQLIRIILTRDHEEYNETEQDTRVEDEIFGKLRVVISNYSRENNNRQQQQVQAPQEEMPHEHRFVTLRAR